MKLPAHVLTKLSLAGAIGAVAVVATLHAQQTEHEPIVNVIEEPSPPLAEVVREPMPIVEFAKPPPKRIVKPLVKPKPAPISAHVCGPCGQG